MHYFSENHPGSYIRLILFCCYKCEFCSRGYVCKFELVSFTLARDPRQSHKLDCTHRKWAHFHLQASCDWSMNIYETEVLFFLWIWAPQDATMLVSFLPVRRFFVVVVFKHSIPIVRPWWCFSLGVPFNISDIFQNLSCDVVWHAYLLVLKKKCSVSHDS